VFHFTHYGMQTKKQRECEFTFWAKKKDIVNIAL